MSCKAQAHCVGCRQAKINRKVQIGNCPDRCIKFGQDLTPRTISVSWKGWEKVLLGEVSGGSFLSLPCIIYELDCDSAGQETLHENPSRFFLSRSNTCSGQKDPSWKGRCPCFEEALLSLEGAASSQCCYVDVPPVRDWTGDDDIILAADEELAAILLGEPAIQPLPFDPTWTEEFSGLYRKLVLEHRSSLKEVILLSK